MPHKPQQERRTFSDVTTFQNQLLNIIRRKIKSNAGLNASERERVRSIYPWALMSHGTNKFFFRNADGRISEFSHITEFIEEMIDIGDDLPYAYLLDGTTRSKYPVQYRDLWIALKKALIYILPYAREEAIHMSAEAPTKEESTAFKFKLDEKLE